MLLKHFKLDEFKCPCCGKCDMDMSFLIKLERARENADIPFKITSGYRCENHNKEIGGALLSSHLKGLAADIACNSSIHRFLILNSLIFAGFKRIGIGKDFIHVDNDTKKVYNVIWLY